ncbi:shieldin complex subunit 2 isoform X4 [Chelonia mydas]|uniref:shieldin complex subunit 2 isoform X4 n=1 Tax=Chelonia mydas TaxID=8469 RepID=UPI0018A2046D|nr:shieldin complex subunit 2 isoform X4 [Chelonia mydas]XP_043408116.1 shieldin complex subunit 2 isoform X4 [Chelonia mydas]
MSGRPQIHIFLGAPIIPTPLEVSEEQSFSVAATETWKELHLSSDKHAFHLFAGKCKSMGHVEHQAPDPRDSTVYTRDHFSVNSEQGRFGVADYLTSCVPVGGGMKTHGSTLKRTGDVTSYCSQISGDRDTCKNMIQVAYQQLPHIFTKTDGQYTRPSNDCLPNLSVKGVRHLEDKCCDISDLVSSTKQISIHLKSMGKEDVPSDNHSVHHEHLSQYLEMFFPKIAKESKTKKTLRDCSDFAISTDTEFLSIMMSSQVAILSQKPFKEQNQMQREAMKLKGIEGGKKYRENKVLNESFQTNFVVGACINVPESDHQQESANSLELFSSESAGNIICLEATRRETSSQENAEDSQELVSYEQLLNEIRIEPLSSGILCSQEDNYYKGTSKRTRTSEDALSISYSTLKTQQKSKRAKLVCSPTSPETKVDQEMLSRFLKLQKNPLLLKNCSCKSQKYSVLVTVVHPCHVKEIQIKSRPKSSSKVPIATIVVIDQSDIERKVVLWRAAAFWSLTVFPGDIVLLTDVTVFENHWYGEKMLQSTFTSQLFNLGSCSAIDPKQFSHVVDVDGLQDLLAYVSSKFAYLKDLPHRQPQKLDSIQHVQLDQLQPDTLVHSVLKLVSITLLTESVYSYKGEKQRKIILTVEQIRDQHYLMVLWGAGAAWCPQLQRKKDHIWEFKYLLAQRSSISGDIELHTTPWSSCECLFDDDKRAVEFKEKFQKSEKSLMKMTNLSTHLEEKCSGCAKCGLELQTDENKIYKQCLRCLPFNKVRKFYRPALMTAEDKGCEICIQVVSELMEKIFLNIPADWLNRFIVPPSDTTYGMIVADLCHSLLADTEASYLLDIRSHFVLDENSYPLQQDFFLLDFHPDL